MARPYDVRFVQVCEENGCPVELPTEEDNTLLLSTLTAQFPRATGLKYQFEGTGGIRGIRLSEDRLFPPPDGWLNRVYRIVVSNTKRKGDDDEEQGSNLAKSKRLEGKKCTDLIILNLPWRIDEPALKNYFSKFGEVAMVQVKRDPNTNQSRGYGFIRFRDYAAQAMCLAERHFIDSRWCDVRIPVSKIEGDRQEVNRKLHIGQLTEDITADVLREHFSRFGEITDVFIPRPFRSFAFITFEDADTAASLLGQDQVVNGVTLTVGSAVPKMPSFPRHSNQNMMHNMYQGNMGPQQLPWNPWQPQFGGYGYGDGGHGAPVRTRYNAMVHGVNQAAMSTAAALASQYTRAHQNQNTNFARQRASMSPVQTYPGGGDNAALATLNILSNPSVVAAIVNAAKGDGLSNGQTPFSSPLHRCRKHSHEPPAPAVFDCDLGENFALDLSIAIPLATSHAASVLPPLSSFYLILLHCDCVDI
ncbi:hypothetical protein AAHC03_013767 [Spirometra sp. Aus1]